MRVTGANIKNSNYSSVSKTKKKTSLRLRSSHVRISVSLWKQYQKEGKENVILSWYVYKHRFASGCIFAKGKHFSLRHAAEKLRTTPTTLQRLLKTWEQHGLIYYHSGNLVFKSLDKVIQEHGIKDNHTIKILRPETKNQLKNEIRKSIVLDEIRRTQYTINAKSELASFENGNKHQPGKPKDIIKRLKRLREYTQSERMTEYSIQALRHGICYRDNRVRCSITQWSELLNLSRGAAWKFIRKMEASGLISIQGGEIISLDLSISKHEIHQLKEVGLSCFYFKGKAYTRRMLEYAVN